MFPWLLTVVLAAAGVAQVASPPPVRVQLSIAGNRTTFKSGEPIELTLTFTADTAGWVVDRNPLGSRPVIEPSIGVSPWRAMAAPVAQGYSFDFVMDITRLSREPVALKLMLNDWVRFDAPGDYTVHLNTNNAFMESPGGSQSPRLRLDTNTLAFHVDAMSDAEEQANTRRLTDEYAATPAANWRHRADLCRDLGYLAGDAATRAKVRWLLDFGIDANCYAGLLDGFYISRDPQLVQTLLESRMADISHAASGSVIANAADMQVWTEVLNRARSGGPTMSNQELGSRLRTLLDRYADDVVDTLPRRPVNNRVVSALTAHEVYTAQILAFIPDFRPMSDAVRRVLIDGFDTLPLHEQARVLSVWGTELEDPALIPALKSLLSSTEPDLWRDSPLMMLQRLSTNEARPFVLGEIVRPVPRVSFEALRGLPDTVLPELDLPLLARLGAFARASGPGQLRTETALLARYGTAAIYDDVLLLYQANGAKFAYDVKVGFLAYLARWNEPVALPLIDAALASAGTRTYLLAELVSLYYSDAIGEFLRRQLEAEDAVAVAIAARLLSEHGRAGDRALLEATLGRALNTPALLVARSGQDLQAALITALAKGRSWQIDNETLRRLVADCRSDFCRSETAGLIR